MKSITTSKNIVIHGLSLTCTKIADEITNARLTLTWLLSSSGIPAEFTSLLVPLREMGSLIPQLYIASRLQRRQQRKWFWSAGSIIQALCIAAILASVLLLPGHIAGWFTLALITLFAFGRASCSVAYKDVLGKTVAKSMRGKVMGISSSLAGIMVITIALYKLYFDNQQSVDTVSILLILGTVLWIGAGILFVRLDEPGSHADEQLTLQGIIMQSFALLRNDGNFLLFLAVRTLFLSTALALPYFVMYIHHISVNTGTHLIYIMLLSTGLASFSSGVIWGTFSDYNAKGVLMVAGLLVGAFCFIVGQGIIPESEVKSAMLTGLLFYILYVGHNGIRLGRKTYILQLAAPKQRATYVAVSNVITGIMLLVTGIILSTLVTMIDIRSMLTLLSYMSLAACLLCVMLKRYPAQDRAQ